MDYDGDGDNDLLVSCPDKPYNGIYFFKNVEGDVQMPVFKPGIHLGPAHRNIQPSYVDGNVRILTPGFELIVVVAAINILPVIFRRKRK